MFSVGSVVSVALEKRKWRVGQLACFVLIKQCFLCILSSGFVYISLLVWHPWTNKIAAKHHAASGALHTSPNHSLFEFAEWKNEQVPLSNKAVKRDTFYFNKVTSGKWSVLNGSRVFVLISLPLSWWVSCVCFSTQPSWPSSCACVFPLHFGFGYPHLSMLP